MTLDLTATDASGARYRLRNGIFEITAFSTEATIVISTEDDPNAERIDIDLAADAYSIFLLPGYYLERVSDDGAAGAAGAGPDYDAGPEVSRLSDLVKFRREHPKRKVTPPRKLSTPSARSEVVDATLVSDNPAFAQVTANETTQVDFVFSLEPGAGDGQLSIGIDVIGPGSTDCEPDEFEPNDSPEQAPIVALNPPISATMCSDEDYYLFASPVPAGETFHVLLEFDSFQADIDAALIDSEGNVVDYSDGVTSQEELVAISNGEQYMLYAYPYAGEAAYTVLAEPFEVELSNCCSTSSFPNCSEPEVSACVCELDSYCCQVEFDSACVQLALGQCGGSCPAGEGSCCEAHDGAGCEDTEILTCVCAIDTQCCSGSYDELCAEEAVAACGASCEFPAPDSDCCSPGENPSCTDPEVAECTCDIDPFCCAHPFDENCVSIASGFCGAECGGN